MTSTPPDNDGRFFFIFHWLERPPTQFVRVPSYGILVFPTSFIFFRQTEIILWGKKSTAIFQTYNWEKSSFFQLTNHYRGFDIIKKPKSFLGIRKLARCAKLCQLVLFPERHLSLASLLPRLALLSRLSHNEKWIYHWVHKRMETMYILNCTKPNVFLAVHKTHRKNLCNFFASNLKINFRHWKIQVKHAYPYVSVDCKCNIYYVLTCWKRWCLSLKPSRTLKTFSESSTTNIRAKNSLGIVGEGTNKIIKDECSTGLKQSSSVYRSF